MTVVTGVAAAKSGMTVARADGAQPRILLAEDSPAARFLTAALLERMGCDVDTAEHGEEAVALVRKFRFDMVFMDIEMPVMDGMAAARQIRASGKPAACTPIIALSAFMADSLKTPIWRQYFDGAVTKPAGREKLGAAIAQTLVAQI